MISLSFSLSLSLFSLYILSLSCSLPWLFLSLFLSLSLGLDFSLLFVSRFLSLSPCPVSSLFLSNVYLYAFTLFLSLSFHHFLSRSNCVVNWSVAAGDDELYDYTADPWERLNLTGNALYAGDSTPCPLNKQHPTRTDDCLIDLCLVILARCPCLGGVSQDSSWSQKSTSL